jgi:hypothetical protein
MSHRLLVVLMFTISTTWACSGGGGEAPTDAGSSDHPAAGVSFVNDVYPIVAASCAVAGCHVTADVMTHWTDYTSAEKTYMRWVNGPGFDFCTDESRMTGGYTARTIVVPGDPDGSYLVLKIAPPNDSPCQDPTHHRRMPPDPMAALSAESIATIVAWIREGALQN